MIIGVINKKCSTQSAPKVIGSIINYTLTGREIKVKMYLDINKRQLTVYSTGKPEGEVFSDLPKHG